jgi:hypothetical protein
MPCAWLSPAAEQLGLKAELQGAGGKLVWDEALRCLAAHLFLALPGCGCAPAKQQLEGAAGLGAVCLRGSPYWAGWPKVQFHQSTWLLW